MRAERQFVLPGGKPLNVARFLGAMGIPCRLVVLADAVLAAEVDAILPPRVSADLLVTVAQSRTDVAIVDGRAGLTVLNGPPSPIESAELDAAMEAVTAALAVRDVLVVAGSQPPGAVARLIEVARRSAARLLVDMSGADLLEGLAGRPELVKVNAVELAAARGDVEQAWREAPRLIPEAGAVVVTRGGRGLRAWLPGGDVVRVPALGAPVVNPFGAGDAVTAALAAALFDGDVTVDTLLDGAAWAAAVVGEFGLDLDPARAATLREAAVPVKEGYWSR